MEQEELYNLVVGTAIQMVMFESHKDELIQLDQVALREPISRFWVQMCLFASSITARPINFSGGRYVAGKIRKQFNSNKKFGAIDAAKNVMTPDNMSIKLKQLVTETFSIEEVYKYFYEDKNESD